MTLLSIGLIILIASWLKLNLKIWSWTEIYEQLSARASHHCHSRPTWAGNQAHENYAAPNWDEHVRQAGKLFSQKNLTHLHHVKIWLVKSCLLQPWHMHFEKQQSERFHNRLGGEAKDRGPPKMAPGKKNWSSVKNGKAAKSHKTSTTLSYLAPNWSTHCLICWRVRLRIRSIPKKGHNNQKEMFLWRKWISGTYLTWFSKVYKKGVIQGTASELPSMVPLTMTIPYSLGHTPAITFHTKRWLLCFTPSQKNIS